MLFTFIPFEEYLKGYPCVELHEQETERGGDGSLENQEVSVL